MQRNVSKDAMISLIFNDHPELSITEIDLFSDLYFFGFKLAEIWNKSVIRRGYLSTSILLISWFTPQTQGRLRLTQWVDTVIVL